MIEIFGWLGSFLLVACSVPQLIKTIKTKNVQGVSLFFLILWFLGEFFSLVYILVYAHKRPLLINYGINLIITFMLIIFYMKYKKREFR